MKKRHIRVVWPYGDKTYCGRTITKGMVIIHPTKARKDDCVWCRKTYRSEIRDQRPRAT